jgi:hypothetical protein
MPISSWKAASGDSVPDVRIIDRAPNLDNLRDDGIEPSVVLKYRLWTVATLALAVRRANHLVRYHPLRKSYHDLYCLVSEHKGVPRKYNSFNNLPKCAYKETKEHLKILTGEPMEKE